MEFVSSEQREMVGKKFERQDPILGDAGWYVMRRLTVSATPDK